MATRSIQEITSEIKDLEQRASATVAELDKLADLPDLTSGQQTRFDQLIVASRRHTADLEKLKAERQGVAVAGFKSGKIATESGDGATAAGPQFMRRQVVDPDAPKHELRDQALTVVERWDGVSDATKEAQTKHIERSEGPDIFGVARHLAKYSDPAYVSAFRSFMADSFGFGDTLTPEERAAWRNMRAETRAAFTTSGAVLPSPLESEILLSNSGTQNPMRQVARVDQTTVDKKRYITSAGITASYKAEGPTAQSDNTPTLSEVTVNVESGSATVVASIEAAADQPGWEQQIAGMFADARNRLEGTKFVKGSGTNEPLGIETELTGGSYEYDAAGETIAAQDVYDLIESLDPRWRDRAVWQLELSTLNKIARLFNPSGSEPPLLADGQILNRPYVINSNLDPFSGIDASATATHRPIILGAWENFVVLDRLGGMVFPPQLMTEVTNNRFDGTLGWMYVWRSGSGSLIDSSFAMSKVTTTA